MECEVRHWSNPLAHKSIVVFDSFHNYAVERHDFDKARVIGSGDADWGAWMNGNGSHVA